MTSPLLPAELEYAIFLLAYQNEEEDAKRLTLVSKRVFHWLTPHIFNIVRVSLYAAYPIEFNETTYRKHGHHVRHLIIDDNRFRYHLPLFPNVTSLAFWVEYDPTHIPPLLQLPRLQRLSIGGTWSSPDVFQAFANVTHLDYIPDDDLLDDKDIDRALYLPKLTHLCVVETLSPGSLALFLDRSRCPELKVVTIWYDNGDGPPEVELMTGELRYRVDDERVVMIKCSTTEDWEIGARGGVDMWKFAEGILASRRGTS